MSTRPSRAAELFRVRNDTTNGRGQRLELDRFNIELVTPRSDGLLTLALQLIRGQADDRDVAGVRIGLENAHRFPAVSAGQRAVGQDRGGAACGGARDPA